MGGEKKEVWDDLSTKAITKWKKAWPGLVVKTNHIYVGKSAGMHTKWGQLEDKYELRHCPFVNTWDPHSFIGNGNLGDDRPMAGTEDSQL